MKDQVLQVSDDFWNIRGTFKIGGILNIGTHASLVKCKNEKFVLLDAYTLKGAVKQQVDELTENGANLDAIINLHPFHTVHVKKTHQQYPNAKLYGTKRHLEKFPDLPWQTELTESEDCAELFSEDFEFSVPRGVDFISSNENFHFSSVLVYHKASRTIHVDDTLMFFRLPGLIGALKKPEVSFHPTLAQTLERRSGAVEDFRCWAGQLIEQWKEAENLCAAHSESLLGEESGARSIAERISGALRKVERTLRVHERKFG